MWVFGQRHRLQGVGDKGFVDRVSLNALKHLFGASGVFELAFLNPIR
jgi:hypothetical protein